MLNFTARTARNLMMIQAAKKIKGEIEQAGLDTLKTLAERGISIIGTYLDGCSLQEREAHRREFNTLLAMGVTLEMILDEVARQVPEVNATMRGKEDYRQAELKRIKQFLEGG